MSSSKIKIVSVVATGHIVKAMTVRGVGFALPVELTLENGTKIPSFETDTKKKNLNSNLESSQKLAAQGKYFANFIDGQYWGTIKEYGCLSTL